MYLATIGFGNTALGESALYKSSGSMNTAIGQNSLKPHIEGICNASVGGYSLYSSTSGSFNSALGYGAGGNIASRSYNVYLGSNAGPTSSIDPIFENKKLYIASGSGTPLIGGDFAAQTVTITGELRATGDIIAYYSSDERLKDNITPILNALDKVKQIGGYEFDWNDKQSTYEGHDVGVIAQEIEAVLPELVTTRDNGYKAVKYEKIIALLIEAIKEQQCQIDELKSM